MVENDIIERY